MTTANLTILNTKDMEVENLWIWHDGYQLDRIIKDCIKKNRCKDFEPAQLRDQLKAYDKDGIENAGKEDGRGDWSWTMVLLNSREAILNGAGTGELKTTWISLEELHLEA